MRHINTGVIFRCNAKRRESSKRKGYYIISPRVIIKAVIITNPWWALHFMTPHSGREHLMFLNPLGGHASLPPRRRDGERRPVTLSAPTLPLQGISILQPVTPPHFVTIETWTISALIFFSSVPPWFHFILAELWKPDLWTHICLLPLPCLPLLFWRK